MRNRTNGSILLLAALWIAFAPIRSVRADSMAYVVAHDYSALGGPDLFGQVDLTTGNFKLISDLSTPSYTIFGMAFGAGGQIYGLGFNFNNPTGSSELFSINPTTGSTMDLGAIGFTAFAGAGNGNGILYALDFNNSASLYSLTPPSPSSNLIGPTTFFSDGLMAVNSQGNIFASGNGGILYEVNPMNATSTLIGDTKEGNSLFAGTFVGSTLYGFSSGITDLVVTIDTKTAAVTTGPTINFPSANDYAVVAATGAVPEPGSLLLGSIGGLVVFACGLMRAKRNQPAATGD